MANMTSTTITTTTTAAAITTPPDIDLQNHTLDIATFELPQNYSILINKLEQLALGLDSAFGNLSLDRKEVEVAISETSEFPDILGGPLASGRAPPPRASHVHGIDEVEYSRVVSDIWIGVILTLLIVSVIFFICSCFLYHKFQQWKNSYRTNLNDPVEICRRCPMDYEAESLPSYTIVSGLPTYDDALEEFRKAGIILTPSIVPVVKIFDKEAKENIYNLEQSAGAGGENDGDNISLNSTCTCGAANNNSNSINNANVQNSTTNNNNSITLSPPGAQVIEISPEQLAALSQKRLSLQIAFNNSVRRNSRPRVIDLYRQSVINRNNMMRSRAMSNAGMPITIPSMVTYDNFPQVHRSSSSLSLSNEPSMIDPRRLQHLQHRGSLF